MANRTAVHEVIEIVKGKADFTSGTVFLSNEGVRFVLHEEKHATY